jgi:hypothetical protein
MKRRDYLSKLVGNKEVKRTLMDLIIITNTCQVFEVKSYANNRLHDRPKKSIPHDISNKAINLLCPQIPMLQRCTIDTLDIQRIIRAGYVNTVFTDDGGITSIILTPCDKTLAVSRLLLDIYEISYWFEIGTGVDSCIYSVELLYCVSKGIVFVVDKYTNDDERSLEKMIRDITFGLQLCSENAWQCMMRYHFPLLHHLPSKLIPRSNCNISVYEYV